MNDATEKLMVATLLVALIVLGIIVTTDHIRDMAVINSEFKCIKTNELKDE